MITEERPAPGVVVHQPKRGFRYGAEAFWLPGFALEAGLPRDALDLGTGSGIVALLLARLGVEVEAVDARPEWRPLWERSLAESEVAVRFRVADVADGGLGPAALVVANPPFFPAGSGPSAADPWKAAARTESTATLARFVRAGLDALRPDGRLALVLPAERGAEVETLHPPHRRVRVGRRRVLLELRPDRHDLVEDVAIGEDDPRVRDWYARLTTARR